MQQLIQPWSIPQVRQPDSSVAVYGAIGFQKWLFGFV